MFKCWVKAKSEAKQKSWRIFAAKWEEVKAMTLHPVVGLHIAHCTLHKTSSFWIRANTFVTQNHKVSIPILFDFGQRAKATMLKFLQYWFLLAHCCAIFLCYLGCEIFHLVGQLTRWPRCLACLTSGMEALRWGLDSFGFSSPTPMPRFVNKSTTNNYWCK